MHDGCYCLLKCMHHLKAELQIFQIIGDQGTQIYTFSKLKGSMLATGVIKHITSRAPSTRASKLAVKLMLRGQVRLKEKL